MSIAYIEKFNPNDPAIREFANALSSSEPARWEECKEKLSNLPLSPEAVYYLASIATRLADIEALTFLIKKAPEVLNGLEGNLPSLLFVALQAEQVMAARFLILETAIDTRAKHPKTGQTALQFATDLNSKLISELLIQKVGDPPPRE